MNKLIKWYLGLGIYLKLLPFLFIYAFISLAVPSTKFNSDEVRYLNYAQNILNGYYSDPFPNIKLWNGPGYPLLLAPLLYLNVPIWSIPLLNAVFLYLSLLITYYSARFSAGDSGAFLVAASLGVYFPIFELLPSRMTEIPAFFWVSLSVYFFIRNFQESKINYKVLFLTSLSISFLALTKVIFGYVILSMIFFSLLIILIHPFRSSGKKLALTFMLSLLFCSPWLWYTYRITNEWFFWASSGSMSLFTMSLTGPDELGDWRDLSELKAVPKNQRLIDSIQSLNNWEKYLAYKNEAIKNIRKHPKKYAQNWIANIGRMVFSYPFSFGNQTIKTYWTIIPNMFIVVFVVISIGLCFINFKNFHHGYFYLLIFMLTYLAGSSLLSAYRRMFYISVPFWYVFLSYVLNRIVSIQWRRPEANATD